MVSTTSFLVPQAVHSTAPGRAAPRGPPGRRKPFTVLRRRKPFTVSDRWKLSQFRYAGTNASWARRAPTTLAGGRQPPVLGATLPAQGPEGRYRLHPKRSVHNLHAIIVSPLRGSVVDWTDNRCLTAPAGAVAALRAW